MLSGCGKNIHANSFCMLYKPIYMSDKDTEETKRQIDENNVVYEELCVK